jgi:large subunit ribosomal protein L16
MFEIGGVPLPIAEEALRLASHKLPVKTKMVTRPDYVEEVAVRK